MAAINGDDSFLITPENMNQSVRTLEYAVRGPIPARATVLKKELQAGVKKPFTEVINANVGDCMAMGQKPITFFRQVLACCVDTSLLSNPDYPSDVKQRANLLLDNCPGRSIGAYSESPGIEIVRRHCAEYIKKRDGINSDWENIVLTTGATEAIKAMLALINSVSTDGIPTGVMIPVPQYPLYSATLTEYGMEAINYYLDEENQWGLNIKELQRAIDGARDKCKPKALVVINPGNPTGAVLTRQNIEDVIKFAKKEGLAIIADEVYQQNVYAQGAEFFSFKKVLTELGIHLEVFSVMSASKGYMGECGIRGGYCEFVNLHPEVRLMFIKQLTARLCPTVLGQLTMDCIVKPPEPTDPSYGLFITEKEQILKSLKERAKLVAATFNSMPGVKCNDVAGAMYAFPAIELPPKATIAAREIGQKLDFFYCKNLLENTGICIVPGSGFSVEVSGNRIHLRTTILPTPENLKAMMEKLKEFHLKFLEQYKD